MNRHPKLQLLAAVFAALVCGCTTSKPTLPTETTDGLRLVPGSDVSALYVRPSVDFSTYTQIGLAPCQVSFRKNWMRDYNSNMLDLTNRATQRDVDRIRTALGDLCDKHFKAALGQAPAYELVESYAEGQPVLIIAPSIANLDVNAPDLRSPGINRSYTTSAGEMTLILQAMDGTTHQKLAEVADRREDPGMTSQLQWTSSVTNRAAADRILSQWAKRLRTALDKAVR